MVYLDPEERDAAYLDRAAHGLGLLGILASIAAAAGYISLSRHA